MLYLWFGIAGTGRERAGNGKKKGKKEKEWSESEREREVGGTRGGSLEELYSLLQCSQKRDRAQCRRTRSSLVRSTGFTPVERTRKVAIENAAKTDKLFTG